MKKNIGIYVHIPFCKSKCHYCDFISYSNKTELIKNYITSLEKEIRHIDLNRYNIETVYIGGGTPSILDSEYIIKIMNEMRPHIIDKAEITIEINPGTVDEEKLKNYKDVGINRISIGLQSTNDELLKQIGRIHTYKDFLKTYEIARSLKVNNINVDLMLGLPNQNLKILENSVKEVIRLNPEHISVYSLILEENTNLYDMVKNHKVSLIDEEIERKMYWDVKKLLEKNGYIHYEISNFAKDKYMSKHNMDTWEQKEYIGIGVAAHSYLKKTRFSNTTNIEEYIYNINNDEFDKNITIHEKQDTDSMQKEYMLLGLRKLEGISIKEYKNKFCVNPIFLYKQELNKLIRDELLSIEGDHIKLTDKGLDFANIVFEQFV